MNVHFNVVPGVCELRDTHFGAAFVMALVSAITKQKFDKDVGVARAGIVAAVVTTTDFAIPRSSPLL